MELLIKRYGWTVNLLVLALMAYLGACLISNFLARQILSLKVGASIKAPAKRAAASTDARQTHRWARIIAARNLFNAEPPEAEVPFDADDLGDEGFAGSDEIPGERDPCVKSNAKLTILATLVTDPPEWTTAVIHDTAARTVRLLRAHQRIEERMIIAIYRERMVLEREGTYECIEVGEHDRAGPKPPPRTRMSPRKVSNQIIEGVTKTGVSSFEIEREKIADRLDNEAELAKAARLIPHFRGGAPVGYKFARVRPRSLLAKIGFRSGDVVEAINGDAVEDVALDQQIYDGLRKDSEMKIDIQRRGRKVTLDYAID